MKRKGKRLARLHARQKTFDSLPENAKRERTRPGSMSRRK